MGWWVSPLHMRQSIYLYTVNRAINAVQFSLLYVILSTLRNTYTTRRAIGPISGNMTASTKPEVH